RFAHPAGAWQLRRCAAGEPVGTSPRMGFGRAVAPSAGRQRGHNLPRGRNRSVLSSARRRLSMRSNKLKKRTPGRHRLLTPGFHRALEPLEARLPPTVLPPGFTETPVVSGLSAPTAMEFAPDGRLFVLEQSGNVKLVHSDGTTFTALHLNVDSAGERGLLGITFDPNFSTNHFAYLYYTNPNPGGASWATGEHNQLSRFTVNDTDLQQPTFTNEAPILDGNNLISATNHNGGAIHFGL